VSEALAANSRCHGWVVPNHYVNGATIRAVRIIVLDFLKNLGEHLVELERSRSP